MIPAGHQGSQQVWCLGLRLGLSLYCVEPLELEAHTTSVEERHMVESDDEELPIAFQIRESEAMFVQGCFLCKAEQNAIVRSWDPDSKKCFGLTARAMHPGI